MRTPAVLHDALVHVLAGFLVYPNEKSLRTVTHETSRSVDAIVRARLAYLVVSFQTLVNVEASFIVQRQMVSDVARALEAVRLADADVRTTVMGLAVIDPFTGPTVRFQREIVGTLARVSVRYVHANVAAVVFTGALVQILASFTILVQGEILGTITYITAFVILALVGAIVKIPRALVDVHAGPLILGQFISIETATEEATFGVVAKLRARGRFVPLKETFVDVVTRSFVVR